MPKSKSIRIIIDTNLWISFLISNRLTKLDSIIIHDIKLLFSNELLEEISSTITKPKLSRYFSINALEEMLINLEHLIEIVEVKSKVSVCRDIKDDFLLSLAKDGKADFLLTGDKDLLVLQKFEKTNIISISNFIEKIKHYR